MRIIITGCDGIFIVIHIIDVQSNQMGLSLNPGLSLQRDLRSSGRGLQLTAVGRASQSSPRVLCDWYAAPDVLVLQCRFLNAAVCVSRRRTAIGWSVYRG